MISNLRISQVCKQTFPVTRYFSSQHSKPTTQDETALKPTEDVYGLPDSKSNLRLVKFFIPSDETPAEKEYRLKRAQVQEWNHHFWSAHNQHFVQAKEEFITKLTEERKKNPKDQDNSISPDDFSVFYKEFLDANRPRHLEYNQEWHKKNFRLLWPGIKAYFSRLKKHWPSS